MTKARPMPCAGSCPEHPACPGLVVKRPLFEPGARAIASGAPNARCGRCGALYSWDGRFLTYLNAHDMRREGNEGDDPERDRRHRQLRVHGGHS
jgi:hypothetical protein